MSKRPLFILCMLLLFAGISNAAANKGFTLVIDAGHGGGDSGAKGTYSLEKNINLNVALAFGKYVEANCPDVKVVYTRKRDIFIPLYERAEIANRIKADLFISVHTNSLGGGHIARGFETYTLGDGTRGGKKTNLDVAKRENSVIYLEKDYEQHYVGFDPNSPESNIMFEFVQDRNLSQSIDLAKMLQTHVCRIAGRPDKGVHQDNFAVLRLTSMPSCLIELGFISTPDEERQLNDPNTADLIAKGIYNAFAEYKSKYDHSISVPYKTEATPIEVNVATDTPAETSTETSTEKPAETRSITRKTVTTQEKSTAQPKEARTATKAKTNTSSTSTSSSASTVKNAASSTKTTAIDNSKPVFKIQIIAGTMRLRADDQHFKGLKGCECYEENGMKKYTYGASNNYNEMYRLRKEIVEKFPECFIIAFKNGQKMNINEAIREFKNNKSK